MNLHARQIVAGEYTLVRPLGRGGFGEVWEAQRGGARFAIKFLHAEGEDDLRRFAREARVLSTLEHPHVVRFVAYVSPRNGGPLMVTALTPGVPLQDWNSTPRSVEDKVVVIEQIARALACTHSGGIVHRDLKPSNILVDERGGRPHVTVLDFGLARLVESRQEDVTETGTVLGTPGYMSPEQLRAVGGVGPPTDLYSLGVIAFELLEGRPPFRGDTAMATAMSHLVDPVPTVTATDAPRHIAELVAKLLSKQPNQRPQSAADVLRQLSGRPRRVAPPHKRQPLPDQSRPAWPVAAGVAAVVVIALGIVWLLTQHEETTTTTTHDRRREVPRWHSTRTDHAQKSNPSVPNTGHCDLADRDPGTQMIMPIGLPPMLSFIPTGYDGRTRLPALVMLHENKQTPRELLDETKLEGIAEGLGVVLLLPSWQTGLAVDGRADLANLLDAARGEHEYVLAQKAWSSVDDLADSICIDRERMFLFGHASGGKGASRLVVRNPTPRPAGVIVSSFRYRPKHLPGPKWTFDAPFLFLAPIRDITTPVEGRPRTGRSDSEPRSARVSLATHEEALLSIQRCRTTARISEKYGASTCFEWEDCAAPLRSCHVDGGRHWPGVRPSGLEVPPIEGFAYQNEVRRFLQKYADLDARDSTTEAEDTTVTVPEHE